MVSASAHDKAPRRPGLTIAIDAVNAQSIVRVAGAKNVTILAFTINAAAATLALRRRRIWLRGRARSIAAPGLNFENILARPRQSILFAGNPLNGS